MSGSRPRLLVGAPHRDADLARLWYRAYLRDLLPALSDTADVTTVLYCDAGREGFDAERFPGAALEEPGPSARDFVEFYDTLLDRGADAVLILDADVFVLDGAWVASHLARLAEPRVAGVSFLRRAEGPGVYALLVRPPDWAALPRPVFAPLYDDLSGWPRITTVQPAQDAARKLRAAGKRVLNAEPGRPGEKVADFHGTTNLRLTRSLFDETVPAEDFVAFLADSPYLVMAAHDNLLLGALHRAVFGEPFAVGASGGHLSGSATEEELCRAAAAIPSTAKLAWAEAAVRRSRAAFEGLLAREGIRVEVPRLFRADARVRASAYRLARPAWVLAKRLAGAGGAP